MNYLSGEFSESLQGENRAYIEGAIEHLDLTDKQVEKLKQRQSPQ